MRYALATGLAAGLLAAAAAHAVDIPVVPTKLIVVDKTAAVGKAKTVFVSKDAGATKGAGIGENDISARFDVAYANGSTAGAFVVPIGTANGWVANKPAVAKYVNKSAPGGPTQTKVTVVKPQKLLKLVAQGLGDVPLDILGAGDPSPGGVNTAFCVTNVGAEHCHCSTFAGCVYKSIAGGTGAKLVCKSGGGDPTCAARPAGSTTSTTATSTTTSTSTSSVPTTSTTSTSVTTTSTVPSAACGDGVLGAGEACDDGNACAYDGCRNDPLGSGVCVTEQSVVLTALQLAAGTTGYDLDGVPGVDNVLGANATVGAFLNPMLTTAIEDGSLTQVMTLGDLANVPFTGAGTPGYVSDPDVALSLYDAVGPACESTPVVPWVAGPWPADLYGNVDSWNLGTCTGPVVVSDADDPANGIYPTGGNQSASPAPAPPYLRMRAPSIGLPFGGASLAFTNARVEATVDNDGVEVTGLSNGVLGGIVPASVLWNIPVQPGGNCPTALHAVLAFVGAPDQDADGGGIEPISSTCPGCTLPCLFSAVTIDDCVDELGAIIPDSDLDGDATIEDGECILDPRMGDGYSAGVTFTARQVRVRTQVSASATCP